jgi:hypothetical protein
VTLRVFMTTAQPLHDSLKKTAMARHRQPIFADIFARVRTFGVLANRVKLANVKDICDAASYSPIVLTSICHRQISVVLET